jgi:O-antigen ligase
MTIGSPSFKPIKSFFAQWMPGRGSRSFLETLLLPYILPFTLGMILALVAATLIKREEWLVLVPLVFLVPVGVLFLRYPFIAILLWLLVFPFFVRDALPGGRYMYWLLHRAMIPGAFGIAVLSELLRREKKRALRLGAGEVSMILYLLVSVINIFVMNQDPFGALIRYYDRIIVPFCMYGLIRLTDLKEKDLRLIALIAPLPIVMQTIIGLISWFAPGALPGAWLNREGERTVGTFGNPGVFTTTLVFFALFLYQVAMQSKSFRTRMVCFALVSVSLFSVFFSFSRGSWFGTLIVCAGLLLLYPRITFRLGVGLLLLFSLVVLTYFRTYVTYASQRLTTQDTAEGRLIGGIATLRVIESSPLFGVGFENHELNDEQFRGRVLEFAANNAHTSHNTYLLLIAEMGLVGAFFYLFPLVWWLLASRKARPKMPDYGLQSWRMLAMLWLLLMNHMVVGSFTDMIQSNLFGTTMWWLVLGLIANLSTPYLATAAVPQRELSRMDLPARVSLPGVQK